MPARRPGLVSTGPVLPKTGRENHARDRRGAVRSQGAAWRFRPNGTGAKKSRHSCQSRSQGCPAMTRQGKRIPGWLSGAVVLGALAAILWAETRRPLRRQEHDKVRRNVRNLAVAGMSAATLQVLERPVVEPLARMVEERRWGLLKQVPLPAWAEMALAVALMDYTLYLWFCQGSRHGLWPTRAGLAMSRLSRRGRRGCGAWTVGRRRSRSDRSAPPRAIAGSAAAPVASSSMSAPAPC